MNRYIGDEVDVEKCDLKRKRVTSYPALKMFY